MYGCPNVDIARAEIASQALREGATELMWIDADVQFNPNDVEKLRNHNLPICAGLYPKKGHAEMACHFLPGTERVMLGKQGGLIEMQFVGLGFAHTRAEVYSRMKEQFELPDCNQRFGPAITPWFQPSVVNDPLCTWYLGEDYSFCTRARMCGFKVMADTSIRLGHIGKYTWTWDDFVGRTTYESLEITVDKPPEVVG